MPAVPQRQKIWLALVAQLPLGNRADAQQIRGCESPQATKNVIRVR
jgi:hypothetical protein